MLFLSLSLLADKDLLLLLLGLTGAQWLDGWLVCLLTAARAVTHRGLLQFFLFLVDRTHCPTHTHLTLGVNCGTLSFFLLVSLVSLSLVLVSAFNIHQLCVFATLSC